MDESPERLAERIQDELAAVEIPFRRAYWDSQVEASPANEKRRSDSELKVRSLKGDPHLGNLVQQTLDAGVHDPELERVLVVLNLSMTGNRMGDDARSQIVELAGAVEGEFANHRPVIGGREVDDNEISGILRESDDSDHRREAWLASKEIGARVADRVRELARLRNQAAHDLGRADHYRLALELQELSEDWLFDLLDDLERQTNEPFERWKSGLDGELSKRFGTGELYPWHYADPFFQQLPPDGRVKLDQDLMGLSASDLALDTFAAWGIDLSGVLASSDLEPRPGKCQHAFCLDVDRSGRDVRILANVVPGEYWTEVTLHESGHAAYDVSIDPSLPYALRRATHTFVTEAMAILSGRLVRDPVWLKEIAGLDPSKVDAIAPDLRRATSQQMLLFARWALVMTHFERELYGDPEADLDDVWWSLVERFQGLRRPPGRVNPDWAAKIHVAAAPVYYHNYLLGELLASQLEAACRQEAGGLVAEPDAGALLVEKVFRPGSSLRWDSLIEGATGSQLDPSLFVGALDA